MLENRDSVGEPVSGPSRWGTLFPWRWSWTTTLIAIYVGVLLAEQITAHFFPGRNFLFKYLALSREGIARGYVWQFLTYQFMHGGWIHLLFNGWVIYVFGTALEQLLGGGRFLALMFASGIMGGVFQVITALVWPALFDGAVVGASACVFGAVAAFAMIYPDEELKVLVLLVIPLRLRARTLLMLSIVIALMGIIFPWDALAAGPHVANAAHLGGMAMGWFYVKKIMKNPALPLAVGPV
jgi:membrane associated rhomboid family serine protease